MDRSDKYKNYKIFIDRIETKGVRYTHTKQRRYGKTSVVPFVVSKKIAHSVFDDTAGLEKSETTAFCSFLSYIIYIEAKRRCFAFFITKK